MSDVVDDAWAAGFLDGEGYFHTARRDSRPTHECRISAAQVTREPLDRLVSIFGGSILLITPRPRGKQRPYYRWTLYSAATMREILPRLIPHLTTKKREAEVLLMIAQLVTVRGGPKPTEEAMHQRAALAAELKELRAVG